MLAEFLESAVVAVIVQLPAFPPFNIPLSSTETTEESDDFHTTSWPVLFSIVISLLSLVSRVIVPVIPNLKTTETLASMLDEYLESSVVAVMVHVPA